MIFYAGIYWFAVIFSSGVDLTRFPREINRTECGALDEPDWKIESLGYITLDAWPWNCLQTRFANSSLDTLISKSNLDIYTATSQGYIGFVQYFVEHNKASTLRKVDIENSLNLAARGGHLDVLKYFVKKGISPVNDSTLLLSAAFGGNVNLIKYLINELGVTKTGISSDGSTALHAATLGGKLEAVRYFVETLNYKVNIKNQNGETPAHGAATVSLPVLEYLIEERGADLNSTDDFRNTLLHSAAYYGQLDVVKYLLERKHFDVEFTDNYAVTALHKAARNGKFNVVKYLADERKANLRGKDLFSMNLLHQAVVGNNLDVMKFLVDDMNTSSLIDEMNFFNRTVAMEAAKYGRLSMLRYLVDEKHANITAVDEEGCNLLHIAARENEFSTVKYLVEEKGFNVIVENFKGRTTYDLAKIHDVSKPLLEYLEKKMNEYNRVGVGGTV